MVFLIFFGITRLLFPCQVALNPIHSSWVSFANITLSSYKHRSQVREVTQQTTWCHLKIYFFPPALEPELKIQSVEKPGQRSHRFTGVLLPDRIYFENS